MDLLKIIMGMICCTLGFAIWMTAGLYLTQFSLFGFCIFCSGAITIITERLGPGEENNA